MYFLTGPKAVEKYRLPWIFLLLFFLPAVVAAQTPVVPGPAPSPFPATADLKGKNFDLTQFDLESLLNIKVMSVAKKEQSLLDAASAVYVINQEDIRRSGATSIPELLRMVPGMEVARINSSTWAISARGFNSEFANKLLVLIDGRSAYNPIFSGVYWDTLDTLLEDIERIEVIRGPGGTLWGANAVDGVINIITKKTEATQGVLAMGGGGNKERGFGGARYGGKIGDQGQYRLYTKFFDRGDYADENGANNEDHWWDVRGGTRMEWKPSAADQFNFQGDLYTARAGQRRTSLLTGSPVYVQGNSHNNGGNFLARYEHAFAANSRFTAQTYYDRYHRNEMIGEQTVDTFDLDLQHIIPLGSRHTVTGGAGYRYNHDNVKGGPTTSLIPPKMGTNLFSGFIQDEIALIPEKVFLTGGSKFEHNAFSGFEYQPSVRTLWKMDKQTSLWGAISRAVRSPSRIDDGVQLDYGVITDASGTALIRILGNPDFRSETLLAYEAGIKAMPNEFFTLDIAGFYNDYQDLASGDMQTPYINPNPPPDFILPFLYGNGGQARSYGVEVASVWQASRNLRLNFGYTLLECDFTFPDSPVDLNQDIQIFPHHQFQLRSYLDLTRTVELDTMIYYVSQLEKISLPGNTRVDFRLGWHPADSVRLSLALLDIFNGGRIEYRDTVTNLTSSMFRRSIYAKVEVTF